MMHNVEKEVKFLLSKDEFNKMSIFLTKEYSFLSKQYQTNYYIDTKDLKLKNNKVSARLRVKENNIYEFTVKINLKPKVECVHINDEFTLKITEDEFKKSIENNKISDTLFEYLNSILKKYKYLSITKNELYILGKLKTLRQYYYVNDDFIEFVLDQNEYLNKVDYEVEIESINIQNAKNFLINIFNTLNIKSESVHASKTSRFKNRYIYLINE